MIEDLDLREGEGDFRFTSIRYEQPSPAVARIVLARPRGAQRPGQANALQVNDAFDTAADDDDVKVVILAADGPHFSSGHDLPRRRSNR